MRFEAFSFGSVRIDGSAYEHDILIDRGEIRKRRKKASKNHEVLPWNPNRTSCEQCFTHANRMRDLNLVLFQ